MKLGVSWSFGLLVVGALCGAADAQSNSLFRSGRNGTGAAPTTQPAGEAREALLPPAAVRPAAQPDEPPPNEVLLATALIAVPAPEPRQIRVHDLLTIIIREDKRARSDTNLRNEKKWEIEAALQKWIRVNEEYKLVPQAFPAGIPALDFDYDDKYEGKGKVDRQDSLTTRVTASVVDVKPNGDLVLEAKKDIRIDEDRQVVTLTGVCRSMDVTAQNTVLSTQLADARIDIQHSGPARDAAKRGWLARLWDVIRPF
jgi:flagellar L-ring protein precursor FlgH